MYTKLPSGVTGISKHYEDCEEGNVADIKEIMLIVVYCYLIVVIVSTKIARSRDVGILASGQCCQYTISSEKATSLCF